MPSPSRRSLRPAAAGRIEGSASLPPRPFLDSLLRRVLILWIVLKGMGAAGAAAVYASPARAFASFPVATFWILPVVLLALWIDLARRNEAVFLANLGWSFRRLAVAAAGLVVALDAVVALLAWTAGLSGTATS